LYVNFLFSARAEAVPNETKEKMVKMLREFAEKEVEK
jgi:hypothetical protein